MVDPQITQRISDKIRESIETANRLWSRSLELPSFQYKQMGVVAGKARPTEWRIFINPDFLSNGTLEQIINVTVPHEVAHLIAFRLFSDHGHGRWWKYVMTHLGLPPKRCHNYSLEGVKTRTRRTVACKCPTCGEEFKITPYRENQIRNGRRIFCLRTYPCRVRKQTLVLI